MRPGSIVAASGRRIHVDLMYLKVDGKESISVHICVEKENRQVPYTKVGTTF